MIDLREQGSKTTDGSGNASVLVGPVPLGQSWWIRTAALDGAAIKSPLVKAYRMGGPSDPSPFFLGLTYGVPAQGGPIMLRSNELLKFVVAGATPTDKLTLYCDGYQLDKGEVPPPFSGSGSVVGPGTFFSGLHADLPDIPTSGHPADVITAGSFMSQYVVAGLIEAPASTGWRTSIGNPVYPFRYWDGVNTKMSLDAYGTMRVRRINFAAAYKWGLTN